MKGRGMLLQVTIMELKTGALKDGDTYILRHLGTTLFLTDVS